jgi:hypothetical protein
VYLEIIITRDIIYNFKKHISENVPVSDMRGDIYHFKILHGIVPEEATTYTHPAYESV